MTANQHECVARFARYAQHVSELAKAFKVHLTIVTDEAPHAAAAGFLLKDKHLPLHKRRRLVKITPVIDETTYAAALHELGHCLHPLGMMDVGMEIKTLKDMRLKLDEEHAAWEWAQHYALEWTPAMEAVKRHSFESYAGVARRLGVKVNP